MILIKKNNAIILECCNLNFVGNNFLLFKKEYCLTISFKCGWIRKKLSGILQILERVSFKKKSQFT